MNAKEWFANQSFNGHFEPTTERPTASAGIAKLILGDETATEAAHDALDAVLNSLRSPNAVATFQSAWNQLEAAIQRHAHEMQAIRDAAKKGGN